MSSARIKAAFDKAQSDGRAVLVAYLMAGDPDLDASYEAMCALRDNGADIIELGAPFTDPMADGPAIQLAGLRALEGKTSLADVLALAARFRRTDQTTPVIIMGYANPAHSMGYGPFAEAAHAAGVDGTILVDLPPEEDAPLRKEYEKHDLSVIRLATPTTDEKRMKKVATGASGFLYFVAVKGITGGASANPADIAVDIDMARRVSGLPVVVGFGISTGGQAAQMANIADGVVVGSAFVEHAKIAHDKGNPKLAAAGMGALAKELSTAIRDIAKT